MDFRKDLLLRNSWHTDNTDLTDFRNYLPSLRFRVYRKIAADAQM